MNDSRIAISVFGDQVSPRFDCAHSLLLVDLAGNNELSRRRIPLEGMNGIQQMKTISSAGSTTIICGVMPGFYHRMAEAIGITVIYASGPVENVLNAMKEGKELSNITICRRGFDGGGHGKRNRCRPIFADGDHGFVQGRKGYAKPKGYGSGSQSSRKPEEGV